MTELKAIELVDMSKSEASSHELEINLKDTFKWFLTEQFAKLREGFIPTDNSEFLKDEDERAKEKSVKEKLPPSAEQETKKEECPKCGEKLEPYWLKLHHCEGTD